MPYTIPIKVEVVDNMPDFLNFMDVGGVRYLNRNKDLITYYKAKPTMMIIKGNFMELDVYGCILGRRVIA